MSNLIQVGKHKARAMKDSYEVGIDDSGKDYAYLGFEITDGINKGARLGRYFYFTEAAKLLSIEGLRKAGAKFPGGDIDDPDGIGDVECEVVVEHEEYKGKTRAAIKWVNRLNGIKEEHRLDDSAKRSFRDRLKADLLATGSKPKSNAIDEEDIPI